MLNRSLIYEQLKDFVIAVKPQLDRLEKIRRGWDQLLASSAEIKQLVEHKKWPSPMLLWFESLDKTYDVVLYDRPYSIIGIDGSQIYPDRFYSNFDCFLINTGGLIVDYHPEQNGVIQFFSQPYLFSLRSAFSRYGNDLGESKDLIDLIREEYEFKDAFAAAEARAKQPLAGPLLSLFDGSFIFWHLEGKPVEVRELFLSTYMLYLRKFQENKMLLASYISSPRNRELCNVLRLILCERFAEQQLFCAADQLCSCKILLDITDVEIVTFFLASGQRTGVFVSHSSIAEAYFDDLRPCFFFIHLGDEIGRVELPWWMAKDREVVDLVAKIIMDQAVKGLGFPMVLAEAHEQAVVKHSDKQFFYDLFYKIMATSGQAGRSVIALKNIRKRRMPI